MIEIVYKYNFSISIKGPFNFGLTVKKPAGWFWATQFEVYEDKTLYTALRLPDKGLIGLKLNERNGIVFISSFSQFKLSKKDKAVLVKRVEIGTGIDNNLEGFYSLAKNDHLIKRLKDDLYGLRTGFATDVFERAILAITLQMTPQKRSMEMRNCLIKKYGQSITFEGKKIYYWPSPELIAKTEIEELAKNCKLGYRAKAVKKTAQEITGGFPDIIELNELSEEESLEYLKKLYGIGSYSAQLMSPKRGFPLDVWSARIFFEILNGKTPSSPRKVIKELDIEADKRWGKYKQYVFVYVLNDLPVLAKEYKLTRLM